MSTTDSDVAFEWRGKVREGVSETPTVGARTGRPRKHGAALDVDSMIGRRFGELTVLSKTTKPAHMNGRKQCVIVRCECGTQRVLEASGIASGNNTTCGTAEHRDREALAVGETMVGQTFGLLTVVSAVAERVNTGSHRGRQVLVRCACGTSRRVLIADLRRGMMTSCGGETHGAIAQPKRWLVDHSRRKTYAIEGAGMIKIGAAIDIEERLRDLQMASPVLLRVIGVCNDNREIAIHKELREHCVYGEWFSASPEVLAVVQREMTSADITVSVRRCTEPKKEPGSSYPCKACGVTGHYAKTCPKLFG